MISVGHAWCGVKGSQYLSDGNLGADEYEFYREWTRFSLPGTRKGVEKLGTEGAFLVVAVMPTLRSALLKMRGLRTRSLERRERDVADLMGLISGSIMWFWVYI